MRSAAVAAGLLAAAFVPGHPLGASVFLVAVLVGVAVIAARPPSGGALFGSLAVGLAAVPVVRDADWVVGLALGGAWLLGSAAAGGATPAAVLAPFARLEGLGTFAPTLPRGLPRVLQGTLLGGLLVLPFGYLFVRADAAFAQLAKDVPVPSTATLAGRLLAFGGVFLAAAALALAARRPLRIAVGGSPRLLHPWEWGIALALLDVLFLAFVVVQVAVLFGGHEHVLRTAGLSYAEYARDGFWQLLAAALLTLGVVAAAATRAAAPSRPHRLLLRGLLGVLCALTVVVLVSALRRLDLYEEAFGLTRLRLLAQAFGIWLGGILVLLVAAGATPRVGARLATIAVAGTGAALLTFALLNPDRLVAERNVERWRAGGSLDLLYLQTLSADAAPVLAGLPPELRRDALAPLAARLDRDEPWSSFNASRERARKLVAVGLRR